MKKIHLIFTATLLLISQVAFSTDKLPKKFTELLERAKMEYVLPEGFSETEIKENTNMSYEYAIKDKDAKLEIRYTIRPIDKQLEEYKKFLESDEFKEGKATRIDPNNLTPAIFTAVAFNISGEMPKKQGPFPEDAVKADFNADKGMTCFVETKGRFASEYKYCMMIVIEKKDVGHAFIYYLFDDQEVFENSVEPDLFHALKFK